MTLRIPLTAGRARIPSGLFALIDDVDAPKVSRHQWRVFISPWGRVYATTGKGTFLHRYILDAPEGMDVDHVNCDGLDNQRSNIRLGTHAQNVANQSSHLMRKGRPTQSRFKGVTVPFEGRQRPYRATISVNGKQQFLGYHPTEELAAKAYDEAARRFFGPFARTNFPVEGA